MITCTGNIASAERSCIAGPLVEGFVGFLEIGHLWWRNLGHISLSTYMLRTDLLPENGE